MLPPHGAWVTEARVFVEEAATAMFEVDCCDCCVPHFNLRDRGAESGP